MAHEIQQQLNYLRAALGQEKKPVGFLIGAGAPMSIHIDDEPLIPGLEDLTANVRGEVGPGFASSLEHLIGHLDSREQDNLEAILNYVRSLAALPGKEDIRGVNMDILSKLDSEICRVVRQHVDKELPLEHTPYAAVALWVSAVRRATPTQIFTTNYDLLMEQALERQRVAYFDGFMGSHNPHFDLQAIEEDQLPSRWTLLWKLHGSINWSQDQTGNVVRRPADANDDSSALVYPSHLKYDQSRRLPYLAMMDRLRAFLHTPGAVLVTIGFSFRDQHINEVIDQGLRTNPTASVQGLLYEDLEAYPDAVTLAQNLPNLSILAKDAAVVGTVVAQWKPANNQDASKVEFNLGDFAELGDLLHNLIGEKTSQGLENDY